MSTPSLLLVKHPCIVQFVFFFGVGAPWNRERLIPSYFE